MMNRYALIPLVATLALLGPLIALLLHRPRTRRNVLFLLFVFPAMLWSLADFVLRSGLMPTHQLALVKIIVCLAVLMTIQFHHLLCSFVGRRSSRALLAYLPLVSIIGLTVSDLVPRSVEVSSDIIVVDYGPWMVPLALCLAVFIVHDVYLLLRKYRSSDRLIKRNQVAYLLLATLTNGLLIVSGFSSWGTACAIPHIGNLLAALILARAMIVGDLADIGVTLRRALAGFWVVANACILYDLLLWMESVLFGFELNPALVTAGAVTTLICIIFVYYTSAFSRRAVDGIVLGKRMEQRKGLSRFLSTESAIADLDEFGHRLLALLAGSTSSRQAWLLLPSSENGDLETRCYYAPGVAEPLRSLSLAHDSQAIAWLGRESRPLSGRELWTLLNSGTAGSVEKQALESAAVEMLLPSIYQGKLVAIVALGAKATSGGYALEEEVLAGNAVSNIGGRIEQAVKQERMQDEQENAAIVNRLAPILSSGKEFRDTFERFSKELKTVVPADVVGIALADGSDFYLFALSTSTPTPWQADRRFPMSGSGTEWVMKQQKSLLEPDLAKSSMFSTGKEYLRQGIHSVLYLPLTSAEKSIGALILASREPQAYDRRQIKLLEHLAAAITTPIENLRRYLGLREETRIDELTRLFNRRYFEERLGEEVSLHTKYAHTFSLLMIDLDSFKMLNDVFGHRAGDDVLKKATRLIATSIRANDQAFRYGGDEFAVILPQTDMNCGCQVGERMRLAIAQDPELARAGVTASIGVASCPVNGLSENDIVTMADTALYNSKHLGGNRCSTASDIAPISGPRSRGTTTRTPNSAAIYALIALIDARDHHTYAHSQSVKSFAMVLGKALGSPADVISRIGVASLLHDIGKIGTRDGLMGAGEPMGNGEPETKIHPRLGATIVGGMPSLAECAPAILYHHEHYDGSGYPEGLKGEAIPLEARILAVANEFANLMSNHGNHPLSWEEALGELQRHAGTRLDPTLVQAFVDASLASSFSMESYANGVPVNPTLSVMEPVFSVKQV